MANNNLLIQGIKEYVPRAPRKQLTAPYAIIDHKTGNAHMK